MFKKLSLIFWLLFGFWIKINAQNSLSPFHWQSLELTQEELIDLRKRNIFIHNGDYLPNSPGEIDFLQAKAQSFLNHPEQYRFDLPTATQCVNDLEAQKKDEILFAAYGYLLRQENQYGEAVKRELLYHAQLPMLDFSNENIWCMEVMNEAKIFHVAVWAHRMLKSFIYTLPLFNPEERLKMERWFFWLGDYFQRRDVDAYLNRLFQNRYAGDYTPTEIANQSNQKKGLGYDTRNITHLTETGAEGNHVYSWSLRWNNRKTAMVLLFGAIGIHLKKNGHLLTPQNINQNNVSLKFAQSSEITAKIDRLIQSAYLYGQEFIKFGMYPDGTTSDMFRFTDNQNDIEQHEQGVVYAACSLANLITLADYQKRAGLPSLFDYQTTEGKYNTISPSPKNLKLGVNTILKIQRREVNWYGTNNPANLNENYRLDAKIQVFSNARRNFSFAAWFIPLGMYEASRDRAFVQHLQDTYLYKYSSSGFPAPETVKGTGAFIARPQMGAHGGYCVLLFMYALREFDKLNPYGGVIK
ncbi:MAG: hypothetical protein MUE85_03400 [Microscillaceae bacterium]|jgi:hypothetical protein|nr:hypothetical protein [Microscillaceae bacterium]